MSYFIFNGKHSDNYGIIVENLPPIVKPPIRYNLNETDGSDTTDIEILGYKAYEKVIPIGFKDADVARVTDWLNGSGQLTLSNEPDIYYDTQILNQIDYEKTIRFRKAKIPFLVQPYKYTLGEEETTARAVFNRGNKESLPLMTIYGTGAVGVLINGVLVCTVTITGYITLDSELQEAYKDTVSNLQNRAMVGKFPKLIPGINTITFTGTVTSTKTLVRSRWI